MTKVDNIEGEGCIIYEISIVERTYPLKSWQYRPEPQTKLWNTGK